ncbi:flavodoxin family protein [Pontiellaceae bacterium B12227]|nr:flavodoxin family protein [Pontiellaceae bacterium B12227]
MKVVAINGSPRKESNTQLLLERVCRRLEKHGIETEIVKIGGKPLRGCMACGKCFENQDNLCIIKNDVMNDVIAKMIDADGIILGSPTYFSDVSTEMKALIDRAGYVTLANGSVLAGKVGAAVSAVRRGGSQHTINTMHHFFSISQMPIATSSYWNMVYGAACGEVEHDVEGMQTMDNLGENMAWLIKSLDAAKGTVPPPNIDRSQQMNFIRLEAES